MVKLLFLDMDGAGANSAKDIADYVKKLKKRGYSIREIQKKYDKKFACGLEAIFPAKARLVSKITAETGAKIVWSTSWRNFEPYKSCIQAARDMLNRHGMPGNDLIAYTPDLGEFAFRCQEIIAFLESNYSDGTECRCAILDDMEEAGYDLPDNCRFFQTNAKTGLTSAIARKIITYLNNEKKEF